MFACSETGKHPSSSEIGSPLPSPEQVDIHCISFLYLLVESALNYFSF